MQGEIDVEADERKSGEKRQCLWWRREGASDALQIKR